MELKLEIETLKQQLEKANEHEEKVAEAEVEQLNIELEAARMVESYAHNLLEEWQKKVNELEINVEQANLHQSLWTPSCNNQRKVMICCMM